MKRFLILFLVLTVSLLWSMEVNVKTFGAKGDGKTDDTQAIQKAADTAAKKQTGPYDNRSLYFPPGVYNLNGSIKVRNISLRGKDAVINQKDKNAVTFWYTDFWSIRVTGLTFNGGKGHVSVINDNTDKSLFFVDNCRFFHSSGSALETRHGAQSVLFTVKNCEFIRCMAAVDSDSDWTVIRDVWIMNVENMRNSALIINRHGVMTVDNLLGVPLCNGNNQRWIDNYGSLTANGCRFGAEGGGFTAVYNFKKYNNQMPQSVILRDCEISAHTSLLRNCGVYCFEVPNLIVLENCRVTLCGGVIVDPALDLKKYFYGPRTGFRYALVNNVGLSGDDLPELLKNPVCHALPYPEGSLDDAALKKKIANLKTVSVKGTCDVNAFSQAGTEFAAAGNMDGSVFKNAEILTVVRKENPAILMRRWPGSSKDAPHAELRHVKVDLDKTPYFYMDFYSASPAQFAIKLIDEETGLMHAFRAQQRHCGKFEVDFSKQLPALKGKKTLTFRIYYIGRTYIPRRGKKAHHYIYSEAGSTLEIREFGFNAKSRMSRKGGKK